MSKELQRQVYRNFRQKPVAFNAGLAASLGSIEAAIIFGQLLFWEGHGRKKGWIYKTIEEMEFETGITRHKQDTAIRKLKSLELVEVKIMGIPGKRHFKLNKLLIDKWLSSLPNFDKAYSEIRSSSSGTNQQTNTEITQRKPNSTNKHYKEFVINKKKLAAKKTMK